MYFSGAGTAIIGSLESDFASVDATFTRSDILNISRISDDKMLRNRALVLGAYDPYSLAYAGADLRVHTPWNYDEEDLRAIVISNSNIPNTESAFGMALQILKEFARITVEKHISLWGIRDVNLGNVVRVESGVWRGKGLITTFGTSMDKGGLKTNIILDERCPRLFGFFDFGDNVYVSTFGSGVWKKHIKFDHTWYDFSAGLIDLEITDLHINNGMFGSVSSSGLQYYTTEAGGWVNIPLDYLESSAEDEVDVASGAGSFVAFSGLKARGVIVDRFSNAIKFGVDNGNRLNYGDYFIDYSGFFTNSAVSGAIPGGGHRGWITEYGYSGALSYPISYSGNYNISVFDIENDGIHDYVSVQLVDDTQIVTQSGRMYDFGHSYTQPFSRSLDESAVSAFPSDLVYVEDSTDSIAYGVSVFNENSLVSIDNSIDNIIGTFSVAKNGICRLTMIDKVWDEFTQRYDSSVSLIEDSTDPFDPSYDAYYVMGIFPQWEDRRFTVYFSRIITDTPGAEFIRFYKRTWNFVEGVFPVEDSDFWDDVEIVGDQTLEEPVGIPRVALKFQTMVVGDTIYVLTLYLHDAGTAGGFHLSPSYLFINMDKIVLSTGAYLGSDNIYNRETEYHGILLGYAYFRGNELGSDTSLFRQIARMFQSGTDDIKVIGFVETFVGGDLDGVSREYSIVGNSTSIVESLVRDAGYWRFNTDNGTWSQLDLNGGMIVRVPISETALGWAFNGSTFFTLTYPIADHLHTENIVPIMNDLGYYMYIDDDGNIFKCSSLAMTELEQLSNPANFDLRQPLSSPVGYFGTDIYFICYNNVLFKYQLVPYNFVSFNTSMAASPYSLSEHGATAINYGNFIIWEPQDYSVADPQGFVYYPDLGAPLSSNGPFLVLQRDGNEFNLIEREAYPIRLDISNHSPLLTAGSGDMSFTSNYIMGEQLLVTTPSGFVLNGRSVEDFRYCYSETSFSGIAVTSGIGNASVGMYVSGSGIYGWDLVSYSGGFEILYEIPSGYGNRLETSNYGQGGQYVFATTSGDYPMFFQKDPGGVGFTYYSGLPESRATMIRLDDYL